MQNSRHQKTKEQSHYCEWHHSIVNDDGNHHPKHKGDLERLVLQFKIRSFATTHKSFFLLVDPCFLVS